MAQAENCCQSLDQATATGRCSTFHMIAILHGHFIIHALASKRNVVCTRTIQVVVLASLAQLLVCVELARCARSVQMQIKHVICM